MWIIYVLYYLLQYSLLDWLLEINQQQLCHQMTNMQAYYVVFVGRRHGVYNTWVECQKNVLLYKKNVYKAYTSRKEVIQAWIFYEPRWKRNDECSSAAKPKSKHAIDDHQSLQNVSYTYICNQFLCWLLYSMCFAYCNIYFNISCAHVLWISMSSNVVFVVFIGTMWLLLSTCSSQNDIRCIRNYIKKIITINRSLA